LVGAVLALASGKAERRQLHPLETTAPPGDAPPEGITSKANSKVHIY
jgi:hypothetical protein